MLIASSSIPPVLPGDGDAVPGTDLAGRVLSGPGLWLDWLEELQRGSLLEDLLAEDVIARALEEAPHGHACDRTLTGKITVICVLAACLSPAPATTRCSRRRSGCPACTSSPAPKCRPGRRSPVPANCSASRS